MQESDFVILAARNEEDISNLEVSLSPLHAWWHEGLPRGESHPVTPNANRLSATYSSLLSCILGSANEPGCQLPSPAGKGSMGLHTCLAPWAAHWKATGKPVRQCAVSHVSSWAT